MSHILIRVKEQIFSLYYLILSILTDGSYYFPIYALKLYISLFFNIPDVLNRVVIVTDLLFIWFCYVF
jgi:hypothetical protein